MRILTVSSWSPMVCGIGKYAEQQVATLRDQGHVVDVLSPPGGDGDFQAVLYGGLRPLRLLRLAWAYDEIWVQYTHDFFYDAGRRGNRLLTSLAWLGVMALAGRRMTMVVHETGYGVDGGGARGLRRWLDRWWWRRAGRVVFHSGRERDAFCATFGMRPDRRGLEVWEHHRYFRKFFEGGREEARRALGVGDGGGPLLVCLGFIQPHKGFDRVIEAVRGLPAEARVRLKIVGSVRLEWDLAHAYARELHEAADRDPRIEVIESFLSDELFDAWVAAADYVVLPYRVIWSSGVAARAQLYGRPLLAADTGALPEQLTPGSLLFKDDGELAERLREIVAGA